jgi:hypothetical protein
MFNIQATLLSSHYMFRSAKIIMLISINYTFNHDAQHNAENKGNTKTL